MALATYKARNSFYPRAREGRDWWVKYRATLNRFYPRAREGRDSRRACKFPHLCCFYPRAREGRDGLLA